VQFLWFKRLLLSTALAKALRAHQDTHPKCTAQMVATCLLKALQAQNEMAGPAAAAVTAAVANVGLNRVFIAAYGFDGAPLATTASRFGLLILAVLLALWSRRRRVRRALRAAAEDGFESPVFVVADALPGCTPRTRSGEHSGKLGRSSSGGMWGYGVGKLASKREAGAAPARRSAEVAWGANGHNGAQHTHSNHDAVPLLGDHRHEFGMVAGTHTAQQFGSRGGGDAAALAWPEVARACRRGASARFLAEFARLGIAGGAMVAFEAGSFDVTTTIAGLLGVAEVRSRAVPSVHSGRVKLDSCRTIQKR
jgi:hypothetical protein